MRNKIKMREVFFINYFTLVELLVVMSIFMLLFSLVRPSVLSILESSRHIRCSGMISQQLMAHMQYEEDFNFFSDPHSWVRGAYFSEPNYAIKKSHSWPYINSIDSYICPTFKIFNDQIVSRKKVKSFSYGTNSKFRNGLVSIHSVKNPDKMGHVSEENPFVISGVYLLPFNDGMIKVLPINPIWSDATATFHLSKLKSNRLPIDGVANVGFVDGHVGISELLDSYNVMQDGF